MTDKQFDRVIWQLYYLNFSLIVLIWKLFS